MLAILAFAAVGLAGCGGSDEPTTTAISPTEAIIQNSIESTPLCEDVLSGEVPVPPDKQCRDIPTCDEVAAGATLPDDGECVDPGKLDAE